MTECERRKTGFSFGILCFGFYVGRDVEEYLSKKQSVDA